MDLGKKLRGHAKPQVLTEQVSHILMEMILDGTLKPGERLLEIELQKHLEVSRSPLREAFRDLEKKGLVKIIPRKGAYVKEITRKDIEENFPVRATLEGLAAREAYPKIDDEKLAEMGEALDGMRKACEDEDVVGYRNNHTIFHDVFIQASGNQLLVDLLQTLRMHRLWYLVSYRYQRLDIHMAIEVHARILALFSSQDTNPQELESAVRGHLEEAMGSLFGSEVSVPGDSG